MDLLKVDYLSVWGMVIYFSLMLTCAALYMIVNEKLICKKEP